MYTDTRIQKHKDTPSHGLQSSCSQARCMCGKTGQKNGEGWAGHKWQAKAMSYKNFRMQHQVSDATRVLFEMISGEVRNSIEDRRI